MKTKVILLLFIIFFTFSCNEKDDNNYIEPFNDISACGCADPLNQLEWLNLKIKNGQDMSNTDGIANVWIKEYEGEDIIIIEFFLSSYMYPTYNCSGDSINITNLEIYNSLSDDDLIYKYEPVL
ncbi:MAG: hypothetical protein K9H26_10160 [Prolixibacteraceae bacterium]|nr:hypothetical protein [Prolixibacteraceae bacterium]